LIDKGQRGEESEELKEQPNSLISKNLSP